VREITVLLLLNLLVINGFSQINMDSLNAANEKMLSRLPEFIQKASISKTDSSIWVTANMRKDHRFFGYEKASVNSGKLILFSIFTTDVAGNPFRLKYGAAYESNSGLMKGKRLKYIGTLGRFIKTQLTDDQSEKIIDTIYFEKKWFDFE
jgi:hypothetical protein